MPTAPQALSTIWRKRQRKGSEWQVFRMTSVRTDACLKWLKQTFYHRDCCLFSNYKFFNSYQILSFLARNYEHFSNLLFGCRHNPKLSLAFDVRGRSWVKIQNDKCSEWQVFRMTSVRNDKGSDGHLFGMTKILLYKYFIKFFFLQLFSKYF